MLGAWSILGLSDVWNSSVFNFTLFGYNVHFGLSYSIYVVVTHYRALNGHPYPDNPVFLRAGLLAAGLMVSATVLFAVGLRSLRKALTISCSAVLVFVVGLWIANPYYLSEAVVSGYAATEWFTNFDLGLVGANVLFWCNRARIARSLPH